MFAGLIIFLSSLLGALSAVMPLWIILSKFGAEYLQSFILNTIDFSVIDRNIQHSLQKKEHVNFIHHLIEKKVEDLVPIFKNKIPLLNTFPVGNLLNKLKEYSREELIKIVPEIQDRFVRNITSNIDPKYFIQKIITGLQKKIRNKLFPIFAAIGALFGCFFGLIIVIISIYA